jgi:hypothetical protein
MNLPNKKKIAPRIIPVDKFSTAIRIALSYKLNKNATEEQQLSYFGFIFDRATEQQKSMVIKTMKLLILKLSF